jgi:probable phosphoglycerate mutase
MFETPNRRRIYLLRHGEAAYVAEDGTVTDDPRNVPLTPNGRVQARKQAAVLASVPFDRAICSGLPRTRETATLVLAGRESPALETIPALEEINGGDREQPVADRAAWLKHVANPWAGANHPEATFMGGERFVDFADRVTPAFDAIVADPNWQTLLLVLHGAVNRMIFNHVLGLSWQGRVSIEQDNCCINVIDVDTDPDGDVSRFLIRAVNLTGYDLNKSDMFLTSMEHTASRIAEQISTSS